MAHQPSISDILPSKTEGREAHSMYTIIKYIAIDLGLGQGQCPGDYGQSPSGDWMRLKISIVRED